LKGTPFSEVSSARILPLKIKNGGCLVLWKYVIIYKINNITYLEGNIMRSPALTIGERLKEIRTGRSLTLDDAAKLTDVSKPMLGQIERGQSSPTITTLWKIATGLKVPLSSFLEEQEAEYSVVNWKEKDAIVEDSGRMRAYPIFSYDPIRNVEIFYIEFDKGCHHPSEKHLDGVEEYILNLKGKLELVINTRTVVLQEKQAIRFRANVFHEYNNPYEKPCNVYNMIFYPKA